jgi:VanZ family protein
MLRKSALLALGSGFLTACVDETIQRFVPDRGPSIFDVGIDTAGVAVGIAILLFIYFIRKRKKS